MANEEAAGTVERKTLTLKVGTLNIGTITGRERELADIMERRNVDILCLQETKWKRSKARNIGDGCKLIYTMELMKEKNEIRIVVRKKLAESVLEVKTQTNGHEAGGERVHPKYSKRLCSTG